MEFCSCCAPNYNLHKCGRVTGFQLPLVTVKFQCQRQLGDAENISTPQERRQREKKKIKQTTKHLQKEALLMRQTGGANALHFSLTI